MINCSRLHHQSNTPAPTASTTRGPFHIRRLSAFDTLQRRQACARQGQAICDASALWCATASVQFECPLIRGRTVSRTAADRPRTPSQKIMMDAAGWSEQDHGMAHGGADDDFQQFLDMNSMGNLGDGLQFDFGFHQNSSGSQHMMQVAHREALDTPMSGTDGSVMISPTAMHNQMPTAMTTAPAHQGIPPTLMPPPTPNEAISEIDAQIQFLQQQKMQQQQRQMEQQHVAFFNQQSSRMVPPTPQSLELQAGTQQYYVPPEHQTPQQQQEMYERFQRMKEQQDVCNITRVPKTYLLMYYL